jgi:hypothetical protein
MNFEGLGGFFDIFLVFRSTIPRWELTPQTTCLARQSESNKLHRAASGSLAYWGAIILAKGII